MSDGEGGNPLQMILIVLALAGGGYYFVNHREDNDLSNRYFASQNDATFSDDSFVSYRDAPVMIGPNQALVANTNQTLPTSNSSTQLVSSSPTDRSATLSGAASAPPVVAPRRNYRPIKIGSWALDGFGPTKLASADVRKYVSKVVRRYDVLAIQQVASIERDLIPRLVDVINGPEHRYNYVLGRSTGPQGRQEQLAVIFDTTTVIVDRRQTFTIDDPGEEMTYDPLVAAFRTAEPSLEEAWTFSLVNVRVDLGRAATEVAKLPSILSTVANDGRGEDDIVMLGLFQADDDYLLPTMGGNPFAAAVRHRATDVYGRFQTSNVLISTSTTSDV